VERGADGAEIGGSLGWGDARFEVSENLEDPPVAAAIQLAQATHLFMVDEGHEEVGSEEQESAVEAGRRDADDGEGVLVEPNDAADDAGIVVETAVPETVAEGDVGSAVGAVFVRAMNEAAQIRLNAERVEVVSADLVEPGGGGVFAGVEAGLPDGVGGKGGKALVAVAKIEVVRVGLNDVGIVAALEGVESARIGHMQRPQHKAIERAEDHGVGADGEGEGEDGGNDKAGRLQQYADAEAQILRRGFKEIAAASFVTFGADLFPGPEFDAGAAFRFSPGQPRAQQIVDPELDVGAQLLAQVYRGCGRAEELGGY